MADVLIGETGCSHGRLSRQGPTKAGEKFLPLHRRLFMDHFTNQMLMIQPFKS
jgi:hypothetical protein